MWYAEKDKDGNPYKQELFSSVQLHLTSPKPVSWGYFASEEQADIVIENDKWPSDKLKEN